MGKRCRRKKLLKSECNISLHPENEGCYLPMNKELSASKDSSDEPMRLMNQVTDSISEIYSQFIKDLEQRTTLRLERKQPIDFADPYNLVVPQPFQKRYRKEIKEVIKLSLGETLKESIIGCTNIFIDYLYSLFHKFDDKESLLRAVILYEAYNTFQNSKSQVGSIISGLISQSAFNLLCKKRFYEKLASGYFILVENAEREKNSEYLVYLDGFKHELETLISGDNEENSEKNEIPSSFYSDLSSEDEESSRKALCTLTIDDIVKFVLGETKLTSKQKSNMIRNKAKKEKETIKL